MASKKTTVKALLTVMGPVVAMTVLAPAQSKADVCYELNGFADTLRVQFTSIGSPVLADLNVRWRNGTIYQLLGSGTFSCQNTLCSAYDFAFEAAGTFAATPPAGFSCNFYVKWPVRANNTGSWGVQCPLATTHFTRTGTLEEVPCSTVPAAGTGAGVLDELIPE